LTDRAALYFPPAFDDYGRKVIAASVPEAIPVVPEEALRFACNAIVIGNEVVLHSGCDATNRELRRRGVKVHELDLSEFHRAGGSAKCMVLRLS
jgi:N-dimethylarginine dimethylaminohydrolase